MSRNFVFVFLFCCFLSVCGGYEYEIKFFKQKVDHFSYANNDTFYQRYLINFDHYSSTNGSILFYTGNEGDIEMFANNTGFMWENSKILNAALVFAEHRYYGSSLPYGKSSYADKEHLGYLTSEQALADFVTLICHLKTVLSKGSKAPVFAVGGSYGGMLAAWIRMKYPHIVNGAVSSSAPVLQFADLTPCGKYSEIITKDFIAADPECSKSIRRSWNIVRKFAKTKSGSKFLYKTFRLCGNSKFLDVEAFINWLSDTWSFLAMTNYPYPSSFLLPVPAYPIKVTCSFLKNSSISEVDLLYNMFKAVSVFHNYTGTAKCFNLTESGGSTLGQKGWNYQACTEMVMPMCQTGTKDMFEPSPWNFTEYSLKCSKKYGVEPELYKAITMYGGNKINASSNIIFTNGKLDPWSAGGVLKSYSDSLIAIVIDNAAHHLDLRPSNPADPLSVVCARKTILHFLMKWKAKARSNV